MPREVKITCDACERDLTYSTNSVDYRLVVAAQPIHPRGSGAVHDMAIQPPVDREYFFCGLDCLRSHLIATGREIRDGRL